LDPTLIVPIAVALAGAVGAYFAAVRRLSGSVSTSTAADLWAESSSIRADYQRRITELNTIVKRMQDRIDALEAKNDELHRENGALKRTLQAQEDTIKHLHATIDRLESDNTEQRQENIRLRGRLKELEEQNGRAG